MVSCTDACDADCGTVVRILLRAIFAVCVQAGRKREREKHDIKLQYAVKVSSKGKGKVVPVL
jgi:hypothetical protein